MNEQDKVVFNSAKHLYDKGYAKAPEFLEREGCSVVDLLKTLSYPGNTKPSEVLVDAGAIRWCMEQLEKEA